MMTKCASSRSVIAAQRLLLHARISAQMGNMDTTPNVVIQQQQQQRTDKNNDMEKMIPFSRSLGFTFHIFSVYGLLGTNGFILTRNV